MRTSSSEFLNCPDSVLLEAMRLAGIEPPSQIIWNGRINRFDIPGDRPRTRNGWYVAYPDAPRSAAFGCWKRGISGKWSEKAEYLMTEVERSEFLKRIERAKEERRREEETRREEARKRAESIMGNAKSAANDHPYLIKKRIKACGDVKEYGSRLLIPLRDFDGRLKSLQFIDSSGEKRFLAGGAIEENHFLIGGVKDTLLICEGYATGASLHEATGYPVAVAFNAGNMEPVAVGFRKKFPNVKIIICGDDDRWTEGNPGRSKAEGAARACNGIALFPRFNDLSAKPTDFNDLMVLEGGEMVRDQINGGLSSQSPSDQAETPEGGTIQNLDEWFSRYEGKEKKPTVDETERIIPLLSEVNGLRREDYKKRLAMITGYTLKTLEEEIKKDDPEKDDSQNGSSVIFDEIIPWGEKVDGATLLDEIEAQLKRFVVLPEYTAPAIALWIAFSHAIEAFRIAPILAVVSPEMRCGKTTLLSVIVPMLPKAIPASNISGPALFRAIEKWRPTLVVDEADSFLKDNEELRGIFNSGHTKTTAFVVRTVGEDHEPRMFSTWGAKIIALIGSLPATMADRSVIVSLKRKSGEKVERLSEEDRAALSELNRKLYRWAGDNEEKLKSAKPDPPQGLNDRAADNWLPLLAIADMAGGDWPRKAREAAKELSETTGPADGIGTLLLSDVQEVICGRIENGEFVWSPLSKMEKFPSQALVEEILKLEERSWAEAFRGKPLTVTRLANLLKRYGIGSRNIRIDLKVQKGYLREDFNDAFTRYLAQPPFQAATPLQTNNDAGFMSFQNATEEKGVAAQKMRIPNNDAGCSGVAFQKGVNDDFAPQGADSVGMEGVQPSLPLNGGKATGEVDLA